MCVLEFFSYSVRSDIRSGGILQSVVQFMLAEDAVPLVVGETSVV